MNKFVLSVFLILSGAGAGFADRQQDLDRLAEILHVEEMIQILSDEGQEYGQTLAEEMFGARGNAEWNRKLDVIYKKSEMGANFRTSFDPQLSDDVLQVLLDFFDTPYGEKLVRLEMTARQAMSNPDVKDASFENLADLIRNEDPLLADLNAYIEVNDLIELNVVSSMNESFAFLSAMGRAGALMGDSSESSILADVWEDEEQIREDTAEWLMSYLAMCYAPLNKDEMAKNIAFGETAAGQEFNRAMFKAFNEVYMGISTELGRGAAGVLLSEDL